MLNWLTARTRRKQSADGLYEAIVAHSRLPAFYAQCGVPDTMNGRLEMILLLVVVVLRRLKREGEEGQRLGQLLLERLVGDVDDAFRQIGIGDDGVARRVPLMSGALQERVADYGPWLDPVSSTESGPETRSGGLARALLEHVYRVGRDVPDPKAESNARWLGDHILGCVRTLADQPSRQLLGGELAWPPLRLPTEASRGGRPGRSA
ncbi:MAG: ubiquinol-cytochrome C chaperone family protein [Hyphomicrobiaceae bacterium]